MYKNISGKKYGRLLVLNYAGNSSNRIATWNCKCNCGKEVIVRGCSLRNGLTKSCGCIQKERASKMFLKDITGIRIGRLTVLRRLLNDKSNNTRWECKCKCGNIVNVRSGSLLNDRTKSCGCLHREKVRKEPYYHLYSSIKRRKNYSESPNKLCSITFKQFLEFIKIKVCHYCGETVKWLEYSGNDGNHHQYNLDRKNNNLGYDVSNCVVCCPSCNHMKGAVEYSKFYEFTRPIRESKGATDGPYS